MHDETFRFCDDIGPKAVLHLYQPALGLRAILIVDNVAVGPAIGGVRMSPHVSLGECFRLARAMTYKNAAAGLPHGGAKSVIFADPAMDVARKEQIIRAFAQAIGPIVDYIPGPDMGTDETAMAWVKDETGRCAGLPPELGGIPLDQIGATAFGVVVSAEMAMAVDDLSLQGARVAVQGFGAVGSHAARFFKEKGCTVVAAADSSGTVHNPAGIDVAGLLTHKGEGGRLSAYGAGEIFDRERIIEIDCDILVPAARPDVIRVDNQAKVQAKMIAQGANIGVTEEAEALLQERGVLCLPDFISNAGGVICAAVEYAGGTQSQAFQVIEERIRENTAEILDRAKRHGLLPRQAAITMAEERVRTAMKFARWH